MGGTQPDRDRRRKPKHIGCYIQVTVNVSSPGKQQRPGGACPLSLMVYENTHKVYYSNSSANLPSTISWFSVPAPPLLPARAVSPSERTRISFSNFSKSQSQSLPQSQLPTPRLMVDRPAITLLHPQPPPPPTADMYTTPQSWSPPSLHFRIPLRN